MLKGEIVNSSHWSIYYRKDGFNIKGKKLMGRQAAGLSFLKAMIKSRPQALSAYVDNHQQGAYCLEDIKSLLSIDQELTLDVIDLSNSVHKSKNNPIFYPGPNLDLLSSYRCLQGHHQYSLIGITHTTASMGVMTSLSSLFTSDVMPWDAIICTSDCVLNTVEKVLDYQTDRLTTRLGAKQFIRPQFPVIPLGVDTDEFNYSDAVKKQARDRLSIAEDDIALVFVGRLSFHAKAHHLPMYFALEKCARKLGKNKKIHIIQAGWMANAFIKDAFVNEAKQVCPSVKFHFLNGKDQSIKHLAFAAGDIFVSLSDNIQETFGLTPLEGMAAGLAVLVSDWNGYRSTVKQAHDGFRVQTITVRDGQGEDLVQRYMSGGISYDQYIGMSCQRVGVDIQDCIDKLILLIEDKPLRQKLANQARHSAVSHFDWSVILKHYQQLMQELDLIRQDAAQHFPWACQPGLPGHYLDPFHLFSSYPTQQLNQVTQLKKIEGLHSFSISDLLAFKSVSYAIDSLPSHDCIASVYDSFPSKKVSRVADVVNQLTYTEFDVYRAIIWLIKFGYLAIEITAD